MGGPLGNEAQVKAKVPFFHMPLLNLWACTVPSLTPSLWPALPIPSPVPATTWSSPIAQRLPAIPSPRPALPSSKALLPPPRTGPCTRLAHTRVQDTVTRDLLPFVLTFVSWRLQVNEGDGFFVSDPLLQVELNQVQHLWRAQGVSMRWGMASWGPLGAARSCQAV